MLAIAFFNFSSLLSSIWLSTSTSLSLSLSLALVYLHSTKSLTCMLAYSLAHPLFRSSCVLVVVRKSSFENYPLYRSLFSPLVTCSAIQVSQWKRNKGRDERACEHVLDSAVVWIGSEPRMSPHATGWLIQTFFILIAMSLWPANQTKASWHALNEKQRESQKARALKREGKLISSSLSFYLTRFTILNRIFRNRSNHEKDILVMLNNIMHTNIGAHL